MKYFIDKIKKYYNNYLDRTYGLIYFHCNECKFTLRKHYNCLVYKDDFVFAKKSHDVICTCKNTQAIYFLDQNFELRIISLFKNNWYFYFYNNVFSYPTRSKNILLSFKYENHIFPSTNTFEEIDDYTNKLINNIMFF